MHKSFTKTLFSSLRKEFNMSFVICHPGTFIMGSSPDEPGRSPWEIKHSVTLTDYFYISRFPVTRSQYKAVMGELPALDKYPISKTSLEMPVTFVSWQEAKAFCEELNDYTEEMRQYGYVFSLPTEAQWEYACRAGSKTALYNNLELTNIEGKCNNLDKIAWYRESSDRCSIISQPQPVGNKAPNSWGIYDMLGNVWEWCKDVKLRYPQRPPCEKERSRFALPTTNPCITIPNDSHLAHVMRGGSWCSNAADCRSAAKASESPVNGFANSIGFRIVLTKPQGK